MTDEWTPGPVERALARIDFENARLQAAQEQPDDASPWEWVLYECGRANRPKGRRPIITPNRFDARSLLGV